MTCSEISVASILKKVADAFDYEDCYTCGSIMHFDSVPVFLSDLMIVSSPRNDVCLNDDLEAMKLVNSFSVCGVISTNKAAVKKTDGYLVALSDRKLVTHDDLSCFINENLVILKGVRVSINYVLPAVKVTSYSIRKSFDELKDIFCKLHGCLPNLTKDYLSLQPVLQNIVQGTFIHSFFSTLFSSVIYLSFKSLCDFMKQSIGTILCFYCLITMKASVYSIWSRNPSSALVNFVYQML